MTAITACGFKPELFGVEVLVGMVPSLVEMVPALVGMVLVLLEATEVGGWVVIIGSDSVPSRKSI